ncbi:MAG: lamin tail domain-containing protein [Pirellulales bacterium]|nr:lamin tail domain-containing protein [Pirellulales bacterium]
MARQRRFSRGSRTGARRLRFEPLESRQLLAVVINEIHYNPADNTKFEEFIELHNSGPATVDLSGWAFTDGISYVFPTGTTIPAGGYVVVAQDPATLLAEFGAVAVGAYSGGLSGDGERIELRNAQGVLIDEVDYGVTFPWPIQPDGEGPSMELVNPALDNNLGSSWRPSFTTPLFATPDPSPPPGGGIGDLVHRWSFNGNLVDSVSGADGVLVDPQGIATFSSTRLNLSANSGQTSDQTPFTSGAYVDLPNGIISNLGGDATFEWWGTVSTNRTWAEIFSFGTSTGGENLSNGAGNQEYLTLIPQAGNGRLRFTHRDGGTATESVVDWVTPLSTGVEYHVAVTWNSLLDQQKLYVNGQLVGTSTTLIDLADVEDVNNWLGRSQWNDPLFDGFYNEFRIYGQALTDGQVADSFAAGPDAVAAGPAINSFTASQEAILAGQSATLAWDVSGATSVEINQGVGAVGATGQVVVSPSVSTTYTISATNAEGTTTRSLRVAVNHPRATPGAQNQAYAPNAAPAIHAVSQPGQTVSGLPTSITAKVADPDGVASVQLQYQIVLPGQYLPARLPASHSDLVTNPYAAPTANPTYFDSANWTTVAMRDDGQSGDALAGDSVYTATIPWQAHRTLVRYRIVVTDSLGASATAPYADDASLNFAYFVYDGVPEYHDNANQVLADAAAMASLPTYHLITRAEDLADAYAYDPADEIPQGTEGRFVYNWSGTMVYNGQVYDNITYRLRGANGRYLTDGKRSMRFRFNDGHWFEPLDQDGQPYPEKWKTLTTGKGFDNRQTLTYALNEAMTMMLSNMMGVPAPETHWFQFRVVDGASEAPDQWRGDFWGINFALEDYDKRFLEAHGLAEGNLYKLINQTRNALRQQDYQAPYAVNDGSDHDYIENVLSRLSSDIEHRVNLEKYFVFHALAEAVRHYDYWPTANKNMAYYFEPEYTAENDYLGKLWLLMWDADATWGPTWNDGKDVVYDALFENVNSAYKNALITPQYYNTLRELRDLLWQPDQLRGMLEELVSKILPLEAADRARWQGAPADAGNYDGLSGAGLVSLANLVEDMLNFAFVGGNWPGGGIGPGGRAAYLDNLLAASGEEALIPHTPTISYVGDPGLAANQLAFQTTPFADPQGAHTFGAVEWRISHVTDVAAGLDPTRTFLDEWTASWTSGPLTTTNVAIVPPPSAVTAGAEHRARVRFQDDTGRWSHWSDPLTFVPTPVDNAQLAQDYLRISEIHYNPAAPLPQYGDNPVDAQEFEFLELINTSATETIDLTGVKFTVGITFTFPSISLLPGQRVVVVDDRIDFESRYGTGVFIAGEWTGALSNGGEELVLRASDDSLIQQFMFSDEWYVRTDGRGSSLEPIDFHGDYNDGRNWQASVAYNGTPGAAPLGPVGVVVNEVLANPLTPGGDAIELFNSTGDTVDLSGWWVSDSGSALMKHQFPGGTILAAGGLLLLTEAQFNPGNGGSASDFALSSSGEQVFLVEAAANGKPLRFADEARFDASLPGVSYGRVPDAATAYGLYPLAHASLGSPNGKHRSSSVVISEVQYRPSPPAVGAPILPHQLEFIEIHNSGSEAVDLSGWKLGGSIAATLPAGAVIGAGQAIVLVSFNPLDAPRAAAFRAHYDLEVSVPLFGPFGPSLGGVGAEIKLLAPTNPPEQIFRLVDRTTYDDQTPWPELAAGAGLSLSRTAAQAFGDYATSWSAGPATPGAVQFALPGDYDRDALVAGGDFLLWQRTAGASVPPGSLLGADGDGDGTIGADDLDLWKLHYGSSPQAAVAAVGESLVASALAVDGEPETNDWQSAFILSLESPSRSDAWSNSSGVSEQERDAAIEALYARRASPLERGRGGEPSSETELLHNAAAKPARRHSRPHDASSRWQNVDDDKLAPALQSGFVPRLAMNRDR